MNDLRIIIVSWNNEKQLEACLTSLSTACSTISFDAVVVDNASQDASAEIARKFIGSNGQVIANADNRGFAKACNQGLVGLNARYVLLLNPDTMCTPGSLTALVRAADEHPEAGILGPRLLNSDGTTQNSIRRFPTIGDQVGIMLKLHNFFPELFHRYTASDLSVDNEQEVDQVMGACFLIRRELIEQIGGLDERYFIWFEEVDYCKQAQRAGWMIRYVPSAHVMHSGSQSFRQMNSVPKQRYFNASVVSYFRKWHGGWQASLLNLLSPVAVALAWCAGVVGVGGAGGKKMLGGEKGHRGGGSLAEINTGRRDDRASEPMNGMRRYGVWFMVALVVEFVSRFTIFHNTANTIACVLIGVIIAVLAYKRPTLALSAIALELLIGSQGHLFQLGGWPGFASVRVVMFGAFFMGYAARLMAQVISHQVTAVTLLQGIWRLLRERWEWVALFVVVMYAVMRGVALGNGPILADANAWVFILLIIPVLDIAKREGELLKKEIVPVLFVGVLWLALKALGVEYLYAHGLAVVDPPSVFHLWIRRSGTGEVTPLADNAFRVFMQSQIFAIPALLLSVSRLLGKKGKGWMISRWEVVLLIASCIILILSLSRSFWIGGVAGGAILVFLFMVKERWSAMRRSVMVGFSLIFSVVAAMALIALVVRAPASSNTDAGLSSVTGRVTTNDVSINSRRELLNGMITKIKEHPFLGSGFGAQVSYLSSDPRVRALNPSGLYTTYAFEWGWLEHWIKFGVIGFGLMVALVLRLSARILKTSAPHWMRYGAFASLIALAVTHIFTPYLNHPLGLGYLMILEGWVVLYRKTA